MTVAVSAAIGEGAEAVICASTGNTAASAAAYAARAGLRGAVIVPEGKIAAGKLAQALMHGARVIALRGNFDEALALVRELARAAADRARQLGQRVPDRGAEDGGVRGLRRARRAAGRALHPGGQRGQHHGVVARLPGVRGRRRCCTATRPRVRRRWCMEPRWSGRRRSPRRSGSATPPAGRTRWTRSLPRAARSARCRTQEILDAYMLLGAREGVFCEPASAASVAGLLKYGAEGRVDLRAHGPRAEGPHHRDGPGRLGDSLRARDRRASSRRCSRVEPPASRARAGFVGEPRTGLRRAGRGAGGAPRAGGRGDGRVRRGDRHRGGPARPRQPMRARVRAAPPRGWRHLPAALRDPGGGRSRVQRRGYRRGLGGRRSHVRARRRAARPRGRAGGACRQRRGCPPRRLRDLQRRRCSSASTRRRSSRA